jgi:nucleoside diphosphate kinase
MGDTYPSGASPETIRGKYKADSDTGPSGAIENMVHGSDGEERAKFEIELIFGKEWAV